MKRRYDRPISTPELVQCRTSASSHGIEFVRKNNKMIILEINIILQQILGFRPPFRGRMPKCITICIRSTMTASMCLLCIWLTLNFVAKISENSYRPWRSLAPVMSYAMVSMLYCHFMCNRDVFFSLFDYLQTMINERA